jgi:hypothetical protein
MCLQNTSTFKSMHEDKRFRIMGILFGSDVGLYSIKEVVLGLGWSKSVYRKVAPKSIAYVNSGRVNSRSIFFSVN